VEHDGLIVYGYIILLSSVLLAALFWADKKWVKRILSLSNLNSTCYIYTVSISDFELTVTGVLGLMLRLCSTSKLPRRAMASVKTFIDNYSSGSHHINGTRFLTGI
jgi:hypothetical protein